MKSRVSVDVYKITQELGAIGLVVCLCVIMLTALEVVTRKWTAVG